jgi:hypothetical protein
VDAVLFLRDLERNPDSLHLSHSPQSQLDGAALLLDTLARLPDEYRHLPGDDLR